MGFKEDEYNPVSLVDSVKQRVTLWRRGIKLRDHWGEFTNLALPVVMSVFAGTTPGHSLRTWYYWIPFAVIFLIGWLQSLTHSAHASVLQRELERMEQRKEHLESILQDLPLRMLETAFSGELKLGQDERISLYRYDGKHFYLLARHAQYPPFRERGRGVYPSDEGFIALAWRAGEKIIEDLPDPEQSMESYKAAVRSLMNINDKQIEKLTMKSRAYYGKTIGHHYAVALLVIESTQEKLDVDRIKAWVNSDYFKHLTDLMLSNILPSNVSEPRPEEVDNRGLTPGRHVVLS